MIQRPHSNSLSVIILETSEESSQILVIDACTLDDMLIAKRAASALPQPAVCAALVKMMTAWKQPEKFAVFVLTQANCTSDIFLEKLIREGHGGNRVDLSLCSTRVLYLSANNLLAFHVLSFPEQSLEVER